jgi:hypothetical protein
VGINGLCASHFGYVLGKILCKLEGSVAVLGPYYLLLFIFIKRVGNGDGIS